jgi:hypothetical protein
MVSTSSVEICLKFHTVQLASKQQIRAVTILYGINSYQTNINIALLADIPGVTRVFIYPTPESCSNIHTQTQTHTHTHTLTPVFIYPNLLSDKPETQKCRYFTVM